MEKGTEVQDTKNRNSYLFIIYKSCHTFCTKKSNNLKIIKITTAIYKKVMNILYYYMFFENFKFLLFFCLQKYNFFFLNVLIMMKIYFQIKYEPILLFVENCI